MNLEILSMMISSTQKWWMWNLEDFYYSYVRISYETSPDTNKVQKTRAQCPA